MLSEGTANYDRGTKFHYYSELPSLQEYLLIEQNIHKAETRYRSHADEEWKMNWFEGQEAVVTLRSMDVAVPLSDFYQETEGL